MTKYGINPGNSNAIVISNSRHINPGFKILGDFHISIGLGLCPMTFVYTAFDTHYEIIINYLIGLSIPQLNNSPAIILITQ